ncbi:MAG: hypothetical protein ACE5IL_06260 [Myxococcota bacterium]
MTLQRSEVSRTRGMRGGAAAILLAIGWLATACTAAPVPLAAAKGTTILFPFAGPLAAPIGYTSDLGGGIVHVDAQFGETRFILRNTQSGVEYTLLPRWVSRAYPDPASPASIRNELPDNIFGFLDAQPFALIDIPSEPNQVPPGTYRWRIETALPAGVADTTGDGQGDLFRNLVFSPLDSLGTFEVVAAPSTPPTLGLSTPARSFPLQSPQPIELTLRDLIPFHSAALDFGEFSGVYAADLVVDYPASKLQIETVYQSHNTGRASIVRWSSAPSTADPNVGELRVHFIDPDAGRFLRLEVAFELVSAPDPSQPIPNANAGDFALDASQSRFYDRAGAELPSAGATWLRIR